jgi:hypothetical protein
MLRKDYIQRQFEEFGKVMAVILGLKREKDWDTFEKEIALATQKFTSLEMQQVEAMDSKSFEEAVLNREDLEQDKKKILAELLFEKMSYYLERDDKAHYASIKEKCLQLYRHLRDNFTENEFDLNTHYRIAFLEKLKN